MSQKRMIPLEDDVIEHFDLLRNSEYMQDDEEYQNRKLKMTNLIRKIISNELTPRQKQLTVMHFYESKTVTEIAHMLSLDKSTVSRTLQRCRAIIRKYLYYYF